MTRLRRKGVMMVKISTKQLAASALLMALDVLFARVLAINTPIMKLGLGFAAVAFAAMAYGAGWAALIGALGDLLGSVLFPTGAYFPPFTFTAALTGAIYGFALYKREASLKAALTAGGVNVFLVSFLINSALIAWLSGTEYLAMLATRAIQLAVMLPVQCGVIYFLLRAKPVQDIAKSLR